jgi:hypothetical protein
LLEVTDPSEYRARISRAQATASLTPDAGWLWPGPQLQVFQPVVVPHAVAMVNGFIRQEVATQHLLHHEDVLEDILALSGPGVTRCPEHDIARLVAGASASPVAIRGAGHTTAGSTRY